MKTNRLLIIALLVLASCGTYGTYDTYRSSFDWLVGSWERTNGKPGTQTIESWEKIDANTYTGISVVLRNNDTVYKERASIKKENDTYYYIAEPQQNPEPTKFKITVFNNFSFKSENPNHDFPKEINYMRQGDTIIASILGNGKKIDYNFKKQ